MTLVFAVDNNTTFRLRITMPQERCSYESMALGSSIPRGIVAFVTVALLLAVVTATAAAAVVSSSSSSLPLPSSWWQVVAGGRGIGGIAGAGLGLRQKLTTRRVG